MRVIFDYAWSDKFAQFMHMSMAMDCLLFASWLGAFVYTTMVRCILQSVHDSKIATHGTGEPRETTWHHMLAISNAASARNWHGLAHKLVVP